MGEKTTQSRRINFDRVSMADQQENAAAAAAAAAEDDEMDLDDPLQAGMLDPSDILEVIEVEGPCVVSRPGAPRGSLP